MSEKMTKEYYKRLYTILYSQNLIKKWVRKLTEEIVYNSIYYDSQSKIDWKMSKKNESNFDWRVVYSLI